jgi:hypothetical protein
VNDDKPKVTFYEPKQVDSIPLRTELTVLPSDPDKPKSIGWSVYEVTPEEDAKTLDYDASVLASTEEADKYRSNDYVHYVKPDQHGFACIDVLQQLWGRPWDQYALNMVHSVRPSGIRVVGSREGLTLAAITWRVTVHLEDDNRTIHKIDQEVEVALVGAKHGHGLHKYEIGAAPSPALGYFNPRAIKLTLDKP